MAGSPPKRSCQRPWLRIATRGAPGRVLVGAEHAPERGRDAEHVEERVRHAAPFDLLRRVAVQRGAVSGDGGDRREHLVVRRQQRVVDGRHVVAREPTFALSSQSPRAGLGRDRGAAAAGPR